MVKKIIIAIDGYSSTGKSTLAKMLSRHLSYRHINTGSMYRAVTLFSLRNKWLDDDFNNINSLQIINLIDSLQFNFKLDNNNYRLFVNGEDVEGLIKDPIISKYVSVISTYPLLRKKIISIQQDMGKLKGVVMEGRDIGSVVFPEAEVKLFITASVAVRAHRRYMELQSLGIDVKYADVVSNLKMRDSSDSNRKNSPLLKVQDAILIDNTSLSIDQQFDIAIGLINNKLNLL